MIVGTKRRTAEWIALAAWVVVTLVVVMHHEPWRDEADSWLLTRDATLPYILGRMGYAGTPALWYLIVLPFAKLGFPFVTQSIVHWSLAAVAAALVLFRSPFPLSTRVLLPFSYFFAYEYCVIARSYVLTVLLLWAIASVHRNRLERPLTYATLVALLFNANAHSFFVAGTITIAWLLDLFRKHEVTPRHAVSAGILMAGGVAAYLQLRTPEDASISGLISNYLPHAPLEAMREMLFPTIDLDWLSLIALAICAVLVVAMRASAEALFVLLASYAALLYIFVFKWFSGLRHAGLALAVLLFALWIAMESDPEARTSRAKRIALMLLNISLVLSVGAFARVAYLDIREAFSGGKEMASFLRKNGVDRQYIIAAHSAPATESILPYLGGTRFWYAGIEEFGTFMTWDRSYERGLNVSYPEAERRARERFGGRVRYLLLLNVEMPDPGLKGYRTLYATQTPVFAKKDERFWLYQPIR